MPICPALWKLVAVTAPLRLRPAFPWMNNSARQELFMLLIFCCLMDPIRNDFRDVSKFQITSFLNSFCATIITISGQLLLSSRLQIQLEQSSSG